MILEAKIELDLKTILAEGPFWNEKENKLCFVGIDDKKFYRYCPKTKKLEVKDTEIRFGSAAIHSGGGYIVAAENAFYHYNFELNETKLVAEIENFPKDGRLNDGKCDPKGRFWSGSMAKDNKGELYCLDNNGKLNLMEKDISISNGLVWSLSKDVFYYADTGKKTIYEYAYDNETGKIKDKKVLIDFSEFNGAPDGMTIDSEGNLWVCLWGGYAVTRWNGETGKLMTKIDVPAKNVTSCAFGGENYDTLYITTSTLDMTDEERFKYPLSGGVFSVKVGVSGNKMQEYCLEG